MEDKRNVDNFSNEELEALREAMRAVDEDMVALFDKRLALSREIAQVKMKSNIPIYDADREEKNVEELSALIEKAADRPLFAKWYRLMMKISKTVQRGLSRGKDA